MNWFRRKRRMPPEAPVPGTGATSAGERAVAVHTGGGGFSGTVVTGDDARVTRQSAAVIGDSNQIVQAGGDVVALPPGTLAPMAGMDAPSGLGNPPARTGRFVGRDDLLDRLDTHGTAPQPRLATGSAH
jgi:hypothetical protein